MNNILIVDDEAIVIRAIEKGVCWDALGIETIYTAKNAKGGRELLEQHPVDVILCDIEMPGGSGLELVRWAHEKMPQTVVLLLTGHADFEYAREAVSLGVYEYLLKPVVYKQLEEKIAEALALAQERKKDMELKSVWKDNQESRMADFLRELAKSNAVCTKEQMHHISRDFHLELEPEDMFLMIYIKVRPIEAGGGSREAMGEFLTYVRRLFTVGECSFYLMHPWEEAAVVLYPVGPEVAFPEDQVREAAVELTQLAYTYGHYLVSCYISEIFGLAEMNLMLNKLREKSENNVMYDRKVFLVSRLNTKAHRPEPVALDTKKWIGFLESGRLEELVQSVDFTLHHMVITGEMDKERLTQVYSVFMQMIFYYMKSHEYSVYEGFSVEELTDWQVRAVKSVEDFRRFVRYVVQGIDICREKEQSVDTLVGRAKKYMDEHLSEDLSRESIAAHVALSENYLSKIFKKETGFSISDYLLMRRMALAKTLLIETAKPVGEIALEAGYSNSAYFIKMFKREVGKTPNEYRKEMRL